MGTEYREAMSKNTKYGFIWNESGHSIAVQRTFCDKKHICVTIYTKDGALSVYVTPSGRIRTHRRLKKSFSPEYLDSILKGED